jgi:hypothetical protein
MIEGIYLVKKGAKIPACISMTMALLLVLSNIPLVNEYHQILLFLLLSIKLLLLSNNFQLSSLHISTSTLVILFSLVINHMVPGDQYDLLCAMILSLLLASSFRYFLDITLKSPILIIFSFILVSCLSGPVFTSAVVIYSISSVLILIKNKNLAKITTLAIFIIPYIDSSVFASSLSDLLYYQNIANPKYLSWSLIILLSSVVAIYLKGFINTISKKVSFSIISLVLLLIAIAMAPFITRGFILYSPIPLFSSIPLIILLSFYLIRFKGPDLNIFNDLIKTTFRRSYKRSLYFNKTSYVTQDHIKGASRYLVSRLVLFLRNSLLNKPKSLQRMFYKKQNILLLLCNHSFRHDKDPYWFRRIGGNYFCHNDDNNIFI